MILIRIKIVQTQTLLLLYPAQEIKTKPDSKYNNMFKLLLLTLNIFHNIF